MTCKGQELVDKFKKEKEEIIEKRNSMRNDWYIKFREDLSCIEPFIQINHWKLGFFEWKTKKIHKLSVETSWDGSIHIKFGSLTHAHISFIKMNTDTITSTLTINSQEYWRHIEYNEILEKITENIGNTVAKINTGVYL